MAEIYPHNAAADKTGPRPSTVSDTARGCVTVDGNLVCSRVWMDNPWLLKEFMAMLKRSVGE